MRIYNALCASHTLPLVTGHSCTVVSKYLFIIVTCIYKHNTSTAAISTLGTNRTHCHLFHVRVKCLAQGYNIETISQYWEGRNMLFLRKSCTKRDSKTHAKLSKCHALTIAPRPYLIYWVDKSIIMKCQLNILSCHNIYWVCFLDILSWQLNILSSQLNRSSSKLNISCSEVNISSYEINSIYQIVNWV